MEWLGEKTAQRRYAVTIEGRQRPLRGLNICHEMAQVHKHGDQEHVDDVWAEWNEVRDGMADGKYDTQAAICQEKQSYDNRHSGRQ